MGTAGSVKRIADRFEETFVVIMGDALTDVDVREVVAFHKERGALATLGLMSVSDTSQYGVVELDSERKSWASRRSRIRRRHQQLSQHRHLRP